MRELVLALVENLGIGRQGTVEAVEALDGTNCLVEHYEYQDYSTQFHC